jgi:hypothetical protein
MTRIRSVSVDTVFADRVSHIYKRDFGRGLKGGEDGEEGADGEAAREREGEMERGSGGRESVQRGLRGEC